MTFVIKPKIRVSFHTAKLSQSTYSRWSELPLICNFLFVEFTRGGELQKRMRECLDSMSPMLGFRVRVSEKGGTTLDSLLSNKNLWSGEHCGRGMCQTCAQPDEKKEPSSLRNVVYESGALP